ncbi:MAG: heavy metal-responsive transcriptional regulator [Pyrinomonadaceae bacterium]
MIGATETHDATLYKIGEVSKRSGVGIETLRFYEKSGLVDRPSRTASGYRVYDASILERLSFIKKAQLLGFTLDDIRELIDHKRMGENPCREVRSKVKSRLEELDDRIRQMKLYRDELAASLNKWERVGESPGHVCGLIESSQIEHPAAQSGLKRKGK